MNKANKEKNNGKNEILKQPSNNNKNKMMGNNVESDGEDSSVTREVQQLKYKKYGMDAKVNDVLNMKDMKQNDNRNKILIQSSIENKNKIMRNNIEYNGGDNFATREAQQQKYGNANTETKAQENMIGDDDDDIDNENDADDGHVKNNRPVIRDNDDNKENPNVNNAHDASMTHVVQTQKHHLNNNNKNIRDNTNNKVKSRLTITNENNRIEQITKKLVEHTGETIRN